MTDYLDTYIGPVHHYQSALRPITQLPLERLEVILDPSTFGLEDKPAGGWHLYTARELSDFEVRQFTLTILGGWIQTTLSKRTCEWGPEPDAKSKAIHRHSPATVHFVEGCNAMQEAGVEFRTALIGVLVQAVRQPAWAQAWVDAITGDLEPRGLDPLLYEGVADEILPVFPVEFAGPCPELRKASLLFTDVVVHRLDGFSGGLS